MANAELPPEEGTPEDDETLSAMSRGTILYYAQVTGAILLFGVGGSAGIVDGLVEGRPIRVALGGVLVVMGGNIANEINRGRQQAREED